MVPAESGVDSYRVFETKPIGNEFRLENTWPSIESLQGRQDVDNMRISKIAVSRWASSDWDISGLRVTDNAAHESDIMGKTRYDWVQTVLEEKPIQKI